MVALLLVGLLAQSNLIVLDNTVRVPRRSTLRVERSDGTISALAGTESILPAVVKSAKYWLIPVPPTARMQTRWGWGVCQSTMSPIYHQFERPYPGGMTAQGGVMPGVMPLRPTPRWPSHTDQFGVYYVRGPW